MWTDLYETYGSTVQFVTIDRDSDEGVAFARSYGITYQPGFIAYDAGGELTYADRGPYDEDGLRDLVRSVVPD